MIAYKASYNLKCETLTYEVGKIYTFKGKLIMCQQGFHFCKNPKDTLNYYNYNKDYKLMEIEVFGEIIDGEDKSVTNKFKVLRVINDNDELSKLLNIDLQFFSCYEEIKPVEFEKIDGVEYDENKNCIHYKNSYGYEEWREFDQNNNVIHYKSSNGFEYWQEFDKNNNLIHFKNSNDSEYWREYDQNNNVIHYKSSSGYERWKEFDQNNNEIHVKDSYGVEYWGKYDENNNLIYYKNNNGVNWTITIE